MGMAEEFRKQFVLADDKGRDREILGNIERDTREAQGHRHHLGDQIMRVMSAERMDNRVSDSTEKSDRKRAHEARDAASAAESRDQRRAIDDSNINYGTTDGGLGL